MKTRAGISLVQIAIVGLSLFPNLSIAQQQASDNRSFFSTIVSNNAIFAVGGEETPDFSVLDYTGGIHLNSLRWASINNTGTLSSYKYGVAFKGTNNDFLLRAGENSSDFMENMVSCAFGSDLSVKCVTAFAQIPRPPVTALMTASIHPKTGVAYFYGGLPVINREYIKSNASSEFIELDTTQSPMPWKHPSPAYPNQHRPGRAGHSSNIINNQIFIMGGFTCYGANVSNADFNSVLVYDLDSNTAATVATYGDIPPVRFGYSAVPGPDGRSIVMFGGYISKNGADFTVASPDVYVLDTCTLSWSKKSVGGTSPPGLFAHGAASINNYMVVMMGKTSQNSYNRLVYILDMNNWKWVADVDAGSLIPTNSPSAQCQFTIPNVNEVTFKPLDYDFSVIQNPLAPISDTAKKEGFGIGFTFFALILIGIIGYYYYKRRTRRRSNPMNPRWMRTMTSSERSHSRDYPLFVYNKELDRDNPNNPHRPTPTAAAAFSPHEVKTYTASDHEQWEQQLNAETHNDKNSISQDIWERMRGLSSNGEEAKSPQNRKILDV
ncbi:hypothetical protein RMATCC62417_00503 [Rhizopus microsporus]|nr:hypothetical protein RMATCC62417_00503 [Rhizopus microsporus]